MQFISTHHDHAAPLRARIDRVLEHFELSLVFIPERYEGVELLSVRSVYRASGGPRWRQAAVSQHSRCAESLLDHLGMTGRAVYSHYGNEEVELNGTKATPACLSPLKGHDLIVVLDPSKELGSRLLLGDLRPTTEWTLPWSEPTEYVDRVRLGNLRDVVAVMQMIEQLCGSRSGTT